MLDKLIKWLIWVDVVDRRPIGSITYIVKFHRVRLVTLEFDTVVGGWIRVGSKKYHGEN